MRRFSDCVRAYSAEGRVVAGRSRSNCDFEQIADSAGPAERM
jgi:hypothetical protein